MGNVGSTTSGSLYQTNLNANGILYADSNGIINSTSVGSSTQILTSNGSGVAPTFQAAAASSITISGDTGSATGNNFTYNAATNAGGTAKFTVSGSTISLNVSDASQDTFIGAAAGNSSSTGNHNSAFGVSAMPIVSSGDHNTIIGATSASALTTGTDNTVIGATSLTSLISGNNNVVVGHSSGTAYTGSESNNIIIGEAISGTAAESNKIRIGNGSSNACFITGISGVTASNPSVTTINTSTGQLGNDTTNFTILSTGLQLKGNNTNTAPPAGFIGEQIRATGSSVALTSTQAKTVCSINLTAGIWDISGILDVVFTGGATVFTVNISTTNNTITGSQGDAFSNIVIAGMGEMSGAIPAFRVTLTTTTTYYLVTNTTFVTTGTAFGRISGTRVG